ncbi:MULTISPECIES: tetratricopeptide repeat protein [unclassified Thalassotalea]|uniref:tetratricopeptide repeat protein n=1 Tax=unclassified Thalassotalea TaxID=2614972 RepID=UPI001080A803|nr:MULTISPECIES: tetratricopeptide repeat protein [unclassified Thalassotalea]NMP16792.1 tetratricopeptide repeat protein [Thalassotalea sp. Y01]QBY05548.1 tetratricopeptide repeat protein [Thalassotalea sp. HSM 43]
MKDLLLAELKAKQVDLAQALCLIEQHVLLNDHADSQMNMEDINGFIDYFADKLTDIDDPLDRAERLLRLIFVEQLFVSEHKENWTIAEHQLNHGMAYRSLAPAAKNLMILHILRACGFHAEAVYVPDQVMLRIICDDEYAIIFHSIDGKPISWMELDQRLNDDDNEDEHASLEPISDNKLLVQYLLSVKNALIRENRYFDALTLVELVLALEPHDPYHHRDRGFLLQQLDCYKVAFDDYKYYLDKCPDEPEAQLLKMQLENIHLADSKVH